MNELEVLVAERDEARKRVDALAGRNIDEEREILRRRRTALEHESRKTSILNGGAEQALQVEGQIVVIDGALRRLGEAREGLGEQRKAAGQVIAVLNSRLRKALTERHRPDYAAVAVKVVKAVGSLHKELDGIEATRREDSQKYGVAPVPMELNLRLALNAILVQLGEQPYRSPGEIAEAAKMATVGAARKKRDAEAAKKEEARQMQAVLRSGVNSEAKKHARDRLREIGARA